MPFRSWLDQQSTTLIGAEHIRRRRLSRFVITSFYKKVPVYEITNYSTTDI